MKFKSLHPNLVDWIVSKSTSGDLTPLKIQKLLFYTHGITTALVSDHNLEMIEFEAWQYGPVNKLTYASLRNYNSSAVNVRNFDKPCNYSQPTENMLSTVLSIYQRMSANKLVNQSHLEEPYILEWKTKKGIISPESIRKHFANKFNSSKGVEIPEFLFDKGTYLVDGLNPCTFKNIFEIEAFLNAM